MSAQLATVLAVVGPSIVARTATATTITPATIAEWA